MKVDRELMTEEGAVQRQNLQWYAVRVKQPRNHGRRTVVLGGDMETFKNRQGQTCSRLVRGSGKRVSVPELILRRAGFKVFQPMERVWRRVSPRKPERTLVSKPLLTGWVFVGWDWGQQRWQDLMTLDVVTGLLGVGGRPALIHEAAIVSMMAQWNGKNQDPDFLRYMRKDQEFGVGDAVTFVDGSLSGEEFEVVGISGAQATIMFDLLGRKTTQTADLFKLKKSGS